MEKKCLVIMPGSDRDGYAPGHFNRVYQYIIAPACKTAGFKAVKGDDPSSNESFLDALKTVTESDVVICDLSAKNTDALYGFAIRHAMNLPVVLLRDVKTKSGLDLQEFGEVEYDDSLRIDTVEKEIESLSNALNEAFANKETNSLFTRLGIGFVPPPPPQYITSAPEPVEPKKPALPVISPLPDYVGDTISYEEIDKLKIGDSIFHMNYGKGEIKSIKKTGKDKMADVVFGSDSKLLLLVTTGVFRKIRN